MDFSSAAYIQNHSYIQDHLPLQHCYSTLPTDGWYYEPLITPTPLRPTSDKCPDSIGVADVEGSRLRLTGPILKPRTILPKSAQAYAQRSPPILVLPNTSRWLKRILRGLKICRTVTGDISPQNKKTFIDLLYGKHAVWSLASIRLPGPPQGNAIRGPGNRRSVDAKGYIVYVDVACEHEVCFKLTSDTIELLVGHHQNMYCAFLEAGLLPLVEMEELWRKASSSFERALHTLWIVDRDSVLETTKLDGSGRITSAGSDRTQESIRMLYEPSSSAREVL